MHSARSIARTAAVSAAALCRGPISAHQAQIKPNLAQKVVRAGARAQSNAAAPAVASKTGPSFVDTFFFDAPDQNELDETFPGVPAVTGKLEAPTKVQVSKLPNGMTVVSQDAHRGASTVGVYVKGGARTEAAPGAAFAVQQLAFGATQKRSALKLFRDVDVFGGHFEANAGKEVTSFVASATRDALPELSTAIAETLTAPKLDSWELSEASYWATAKLEALKSAPGAAISADVAAAVFGEASPLGHHALPSAAQWGKLTTDDVKSFLSAHVQGNNMVLAGVNVDHAALVEQADLLLMGVPEGAATKFAATAPRGGEYITRAETDSAALGLGFGLTGLDAKAQAAVAVLTAALGGVAGPRRFTSVRKNALSTLAEKIAAGESGVPAGSKLTATSQQFSDATLLSFQGATTGAAAGDWLALAVSTLKDIAGGKLTEEEITRAKNVAALDAVGPLSGISGLRNDLGSQLALHGKHTDAAAQVAAFGAVSKADVEKAAATVLKSGVPGVAVRGNAASVPRFDALASSML